MILSHPDNCECRCHIDTENKKMEWVNLQEDAPNRRCFSGAALLGFTNPRGFRCRDCGQYYGVHHDTNLLRPIKGNPTFGWHPRDTPGRFAFVSLLGWRVADWLTPTSAPVWLQEKIRAGLQPPVWVIVTRWTMDR